MIAEEHLAEFVADVLNCASEQYEFPDMTDTLLRECRNRTFSESEGKGSKAFAKFIVRLSELMPGRILKNMVYLQSQVDSPTKFPEEFKDVVPSEDTNGEEDGSAGNALNSTPVGNESQTSVELANLRRFLRYYSEGMVFFKQLNACSSTLCELLASNVKAEVIEVMKFLVSAHGYKMECAKDGVRRMVHKIWDKGSSSDEEGSVRETLLACFKTLYLEADSASEAPSKRKETLPSRRRGALAIISMLGYWDKDTASERKDLIAKFGLADGPQDSVLFTKHVAKNTGKENESASGIENVVGSVDDEFSDAILRIREKEILYGSKSLLRVFAPMVPQLEVMAVLALCKLMCVSSEFCEQNLHLLFTILEKSKNPVVRSNIIIGLGDIAVAFNSLIDQNITYLYNRLSDADTTVKKNTLMVLSHLILNGMVKVKGQIGEMAKCLVDKDSRISDLAKLFFSELSTKDNAIYNNLPDIISNLSQPESGIPEEDFRIVMKHLFEFLRKERQVEGIIEKLCARFRSAESERLWRDIGFCISLLTINSERPLRKLIDAFPLYADKLYEPSLHKSIVEVVQKARKSAKPELKVVLDEFDTKVAEASKKSHENHETVRKVAGYNRGNKEGDGMDVDP
ncbi:Condensin complex subunit [Phlyctochytrium bullatum]|nr:Condensin complex subunit [Phlyctochytrium bullatum]